MTIVVLSARAGSPGTSTVWLVRERAGLAVLAFAIGMQPLPRGSSFSPSLPRRLGEGIS